MQPEMLSKADFLFVFLFLMTHINQSQTDCIQDCSSTSLHVTHMSPHFTPCSIQSQSCALSNSSRLFATAPQDKTNGDGWYLYRDPVDNQYEKIALNFSWGPQHDGTIMSLHGYKISLFQRNQAEHFLFFCINGTLDFFKNAFLTYYYDCLGTSADIEFIPQFYSETNIPVRVRNLPSPLHNVDDQQLTINILIPSCEDQKLENVFKCRQLKDFSVSLGNVSCKNQSVEVFYNLPPLFGNFANILISQIMTKEHLMKVELSNNPENDYYIVHMPEAFSLNDSFSLSLWGSSIPGVRKDVFFNFSSCIDTTPAFPGGQLAAIIGVVSLVLVVLGISLIHARYRSKHVDKLKSSSSMYKDLGKIHDIDGDESVHSQESVDVVAAMENAQKCVTVFLLFVDDHPKHKNTVLNFARYLHGDLKFNVVTELFERQTIAEDPASWMDKHFVNSDKILVIWSPGATKAWEKYENLEVYEHDLFTPVLKHIRNDIFRKKNVGKYYFGCFDYCTLNDIPEKFRKDARAFPIMSRFEDLYYFLKGMEKYIAGGVLKNNQVSHDHYFDPTINTYGPSLKASIGEMCEYVKANPKWYLEEHNSEGFPENYYSVICSDELEKNVLDILPPVHIVANSSNDALVLHTAQGEQISSVASFNPISSQYPTSESSHEVSTAVVDNDRLHYVESGSCNSSLASHSATENVNHFSKDSGFHSSFSNEQLHLPISQKLVSRNEPLSEFHSFTFPAVSNQEVTKPSYVSSCDSGVGTSSFAPSNVDNQQQFDSVCTKPLGRNFFSAVANNEVNKHLYRPQGKQTFCGGVPLPPVLLAVPSQKSMHDEDRRPMVKIAPLDMAEPDPMKSLVTINNFVHH